jgi:hypothetical protein
MHCSVHGDGQLFPQKSEQQIAIAWDVMFLSGTGWLSVTFAIRNNVRLGFSSFFIDSVHSLVFPVVSKNVIICAFQYNLPSIHEIKVSFF